MSGSHADVSKHVRAYVAVFIALAIGTIVTVAAAQVHIPHPMNYVVAMLIALFKASLVAAIFMHLKWERAANIWILLALCAVFFAALMLLPSLTTFDLPKQAQRIGAWG
ncbi:MAG: cytochrome C oxidase subunit IV family protein [Planctomycetes bacterium]|nr:cytochrome C oxidase subunit IV family protein [Planctomycetota bacterium]